MAVTTIFRIALERLSGKTFIDDQIARQFLRMAESKGEREIIKNFDSIKSWFHEKYDSLSNTHASFIDMPYIDQANMVLANHYTPLVGKEFHESAYDWATTNGFTEFVQPFNESIFLGFTAADIACENTGEILTTVTENGDGIVETVIEGAGELIVELFSFLR